MAVFIYLRVFARNRQRNPFCTLFWCLAWGSSPDLCLWKHWKINLKSEEMILHNRWITIKEIANDVGNFYWCFRHEKNGNEDCTKIAKFWAKNNVGWTSLRRCLRCSTSWRIMGVWLWHWNHSPIISIEASRKGKTEKNTSSSVKCEGFALCFLRLQGRSTSWIFATRSYGQKYCLEVIRQLSLSSSSETHRIVEKLIMKFTPW